MDKQDDIKARILDWMSHEGYPLEFKVANSFRSNRFQTFQGHYIKDFKTEIPREIDVLAQMSTRISESFLRISYVVECKKTDNKPWIIFTDYSTQISPGACISQSIATKSAETILWILAGDKEIQNLSIFKTPKRPGFNGRQAFSSQYDLVYSTLQSIMSACYSKRLDYEKHHKNLEDNLSFGILLIPLIVIEGRLFETFYNLETGDIDIEEKDHIRLHWRGSEAWPLHSTMDIVTIKYLPDFVNKISSETAFLLDKMAIVFQLVKQCVDQKGLEPIKDFSNTSRGVIGLPPLLRELMK